MEQGHQHEVWIGGVRYLTEPDFGQESQTTEGSPSDAELSPDVLMWDRDTLWMDRLRTISEVFTDIENRLRQLASIPISMPPSSQSDQTVTPSGPVEHICDCAEPWPTYRLMSLSQTRIAIACDRCHAWLWYDRIPVPDAVLRQNSGNAWP